MQKIIIITISLLFLFSFILIWLANYPAEQLARRMSTSKNFIELNKLDNEFFALIISSHNHRRDSIKKERTKHVFEYSFQKNDTLPKLPLVNNDEVIKKFSQQSSLVIMKLSKEFPELYKYPGETQHI